MKVFSYLVVAAGYLSHQVLAEDVIPTYEESLRAQAWNINALQSDDYSNNNKKTSIRGATLGDDNARTGYPETSLLEDKLETGIALSGGGSRAFISSVGYLRGLLDINLIEKTRYISSVSGGSWANMAFTYHDPHATKLNDKDFLGKIIEPSKLTRSVLRRMNKKSARAFPVNSDFVSIVLSKLLFSDTEIVDIYPTTVAEVFLAPAGIDISAQVVVNKEMLDDIVARNPKLVNETFIMPNLEKKPYPIMNAAVLGPKLASPFSVVNDDYIPIEFNPLFVGCPEPHLFQYADGDGKLFNFSVGGFVETYAFGGSASASYNESEASANLAPPFYGLGPSNYTSILENVPLPSRQFGILNMTAASSFAPGSILAGSPLLKELDNTMGLEVEYWTPVTHSPTEPVFSSAVLVADGAAVENNGFLSLLRRGMKEIVVFVHSPIPLKPRSKYNPYRRQPMPSDIDPAFSCFFGIDHEVKNVAENLSHNQVFPRFRFPSIIDEMQQKQANGTGIVVRQELRTVENAYWGIKANQQVGVTWVYLSRCSKWEDQLPKATRKLVVPKKNPEDPSSLATSGAFANFPHFPTSQLHYTKEQSNLLANLAGWVIQENAELFKKALNGGAAFETLDISRLSSLS